MPPQSCSTKSLNFSWSSGCKTIPAIPAGRRTDDGRPGFNQGGNFLEVFQWHGLRLRQDQDAITHAVRQNNASVPDAHPREQHFRIAVVVVIAFAQCRRDGFPLLAMPDVVAVIEKRVSDEFALLQQVGTTREVGIEGRRLVPPGDARLIMRAGDINITRLGGQRGRLAEVMDADFVQAIAERLVGNRFHGRTAFLPIPAPAT